MKLLPKAHKCEAQHAEVPVLVLVLTASFTSDRLQRLRMSAQATCCQLVTHVAFWSEPWYENTAEVNGPQPEEMRLKVKTASGFFLRGSLHCFDWLANCQPD